MSTNVIMPQLGESVVEGTVGKWLKHAGDPVNAFDPLLEVNTDKVDTEVPAPATGTLLKVYVPEGATVPAGTLLAVIGQPGEALPEGGHGHSAPNSPSPAAPVASPTTKRDLGFISPVVARLADEFQVDLQQVPGTGQGGRITKKDVQAYLDQRGPAPAAPATPAAVVVNDVDDFIPVEGMRKLIAEHMVRSERTAPHVTCVWEVDLSAVLAHQAAHTAAFARDGVTLTLTAYFVAATVAALRAVPLVNSQWAEDKILLKREVNLGLAVALDEGLIVPVLKRADEKSLLGLARDINDLARRARAGALKPDEVQGGTFTITNHGVSGSLLATPIINQPQTGILGVGVMQKRVVVINDAIAIRPMVYLTLTFDHRVLDGAVGDRFMRVLTDTLAGWR